MADSPASPAQSFPRWTLFLASVVLGVLAVRALVVPLFVWDMLHYPFDYFFNEGDTLFYTLRLVHGQPVYNNSTALPLLGNIYPPVFLWITALLGKLGGLSLESDRAYALIPLLLIMLLCALFLRRAKALNAVVAGAVLLVPCCYSMSHFLVMPRCDAWTTAFSLGSLYFLSAPETPRRGLILGALLSALALFTKQTALFGVFAVHLTLLIQRPRKGFLAAGAAVLFCALLLAISLVQFGPVMIEALTMTSGRTFDGSRFVRYYVPVVMTLGPIAALALLRARTDLANRRWDLLDSYILGHGLQSGLMLFVQSSSNYFLTVYPGLILSAALVLDAWLKHTASRRPAREFSLAAAATAMLVALQLWVQVPFEQTVTPPDKKEFDQALQARLFLRELNEPVYSEHLWGVIADRESTQTYFVESTHASCLKPGHLPAGTLEAPFREKKFGRVMLFEGVAFHDPRFFDEILKTYHVHHDGFLKVCFGDAGDLHVLFLVRNE